MGRVSHDGKKMAKDIQKENAEKGLCKDRRGDGQTLHQIFENTQS